MVRVVGKYSLYGTVGVGSFGKVRYAINNETNEEVAIKEISKELIENKKLGPQIKREIMIMTMIKHEHVVSVRAVFATDLRLFIVMDFVGGGELFEKVASEGKLTEAQSRLYFKQLIDGVEYLHNNGICHRDLKPEVIFKIIYTAINKFDIDFLFLYIYYFKCRTSYWI